MGVKRTIKKFVGMFKEKQMIPIPVLTDSTQMLKGKTALISGGSGGIGFAIAKAFLNSGCRVILAGTSEEKLKRCCRELDRESDVRYTILNVLDVSGLQQAIKDAVSLFEEGRIDILVNAHGVGGGGVFLDITEEEYDRVLDINMKGTYFLSQAVGKYMVENKIKGHILNITSSSALRPAWRPYVVSKWALRGFTLGLAETLLPYGIVVNAIAPGPTATPMLGKDASASLYRENQPSGRYAIPEEMANLAVFLASDMGNLIVGDTVYMTGGSGVITLHH